MSIRFRFRFPHGYPWVPMGPHPPIRFRFDTDSTFEGPISISRFDGNWHCISAKKRTHGVCWRVGRLSECFMVFGTARPLIRCTLRSRHTVFHVRRHLRYRTGPSPIRTDVHRFGWSDFDFDSISISIFPWGPMGTHGDPWEPMGTHGSPWGPMGPHGFPWRNRNRNRIEIEILPPKSVHISSDRNRPWLLGTKKKWETMKRYWWFFENANRRRPPDTSP